MPDVPRADLERIIAGIRLVVFDFDGVFTDNAVLVLEDGREAVRCSRFDGFGLRLLEKSGVTPMILSTEVNPVVSARARKLNIECRQACEDKGQALAEILRERGLSTEQVAFVGNDINDIACLQMAALPIVVSDAHPDVVGLASYISSRTGGNGAVREICDWIAGVRQANGSRLS